MQSQPQAIHPHGAVHPIGKLAVSFRRATCALLALLAAGGLAIVWRFDPAQWHLPLCTFHCITGLYCPGCGATRATHELLHGRVLAALHDNALWVALFPLACYSGVSQLRWLLWGRPLWGDPVRRIWFFPALGLLAVLFLVLRNVPVYPLVLLAPGG
jgi:hypothetical protein